MVLDRTRLAVMLTSAARLLAAHTDQLSEIDSRFGDGDHGITIGKISRLMLERIPRLEGENVRSFLDELGMAIMEVKGGSAGPLYGTMVAGLGAALGETENELGAGGVKRMFSGCLEEMEGLTSAKVGDKTMMDALIPAVEAAQACDGGIGEVLAAAASAAQAGCRASEGFASKFGRARSYKEQTIGTPDAGAVSTSLFFRGFADGFLLPQPN